MTAGDRPTRPSISDGLFYWVAGACGFATGIVGGAFHLTVDALLRWPIWLTERLGPGPLTIAAAAGIAAVGTTLAFLLTQRIAPEASGSGVFQYWEEQGLWPELQGILSEKFVQKGDYMVAPPQFAEPALNYDGYRAGIRRVNGSWKFSYFVDG